MVGYASLVEVEVVNGPVVEVAIDNDLSIETNWCDLLVSALIHDIEPVCNGRSCALSLA